MASLRRISGSIFSGRLCSRVSSNGMLSVSPASSQSLIPPRLLIPSRGIASKLFVGGLSYYTTEQTLSESFSQYGQVLEATVVMDRVSDRSKGFGFITFASEDAAYKALTEMNGKALNGRTIFVDYAKPKTVRGEMPIARGPPEPVGSS